jgi:hypothetical protein
VDGASAFSEAWFVPVLALKWKMSYSTADAELFHTVIIIDISFLNVKHNRLAFRESLPWQSQIFLCELSDLSS